jgi:hypothetical protein
MTLLARIGTPAVWVLSAATNVVLRLAGMKVPDPAFLPGPM